jgi:hypothetical protein
MTVTVIHSTNSAERSAHPSAVHSSSPALRIGAVVAPQQEVGEGAPGRRAPVRGTCSM